MARRKEPAAHVALRQVVSVPELTSPPLSQSVENKVSRVEVAMSLVVGELATLHRDVEAVAVGPRGAHRHPRVVRRGEVVVEFEVIPELACERRSSEDPR